MDAKSSSRCKTDGLLGGRGRSLLWAAVFALLLACACAAFLRRGDAPSDAAPPAEKASHPHLVLTKESAVPTSPNLKVAFIADTGSKGSFREVLRLIVREHTDFVVLQGDLTYDGETAQEWFSAIDGELAIPYFVAKGNHDVDWRRLGSGLHARMEKWGVPPEHGNPTTINYSVVHKGLKMVFVGDEETNPSRASFVDTVLENDDHLWRICSWHKNMRATNVGPKPDEMGWGVYEACRRNAAIVAQGHSHTYSRSKTITRDVDQAVDETCGDPFEVCVGPGRHFFFDSSLGGRDIRPLSAPHSSLAHWGATHTGSSGAFFVTFHVDGDPTKAAAFFKTVDGHVIDPPPSTGRSSLAITRTF